MKIVGVLPLWDDEKQSLWMLPGYLEGLVSTGVLPVMLPLCDDVSVLDAVLEKVDGLLFTGGQDLSPDLYGERRLGTCGEVCPKRDAQESYLLKKAIKQGLPFLGICRGLQILNVATGGSLFQDLPSQRNSKISHCMKPPYDRSVHEVKLSSGGMLFNIFGKEELQVNSYHHQGIKVLSHCLESEAVSEDGIVEAARVKNGGFELGVQWHPEFFSRNDMRSYLLFEAFAKAL